MWILLKQWGVAWTWWTNQILDLVKGISILVRAFTLTASRFWTRLLQCHKCELLNFKLQSQVLCNITGQSLLCAEQQELVSGLYQPTPGCRLRALAVVTSNTDMVNSRGSATYLTLGRLIQPPREHSTFRCCKPSVSLQQLSNSAFANNQGTRSISNIGS